MLIASTLNTQSRLSLLGHRSDENADAHGLVHFDAAEKRDVVRRRGAKHLIGTGAPAQLEHACSNATQRKAVKAKRRPAGDASS